VGAECRSVNTGKREIANKDECGSVSQRNSLRTEQIHEHEKHWNWIYKFHAAKQLLAVHPRMVGAHCRGDGDSRFDGMGYNLHSRII
jgi:hypothetical protein